jgi:hypothetical protein
MATNKANGKDEDNLNFDQDTPGAEVEAEEGVVLKKPVKEAAPEIEIEVIDDLPEEERKLNEVRRKKLKQAEEELSDIPASKDALEEEIRDYGKRSQQRMRQLYMKYQDEKSAREAATRENEEAIRYAQSLSGELTQTKAYLSKGESYLLEQVKKRTELALNEAKRKYEEAYSSGDGAKIADALVEMNNAAAEKREADAFKPLQRESLQKGERGVQGVERAGESVQPTPRPNQPDPQAVAWAAKNDWFGKDEVMTATAYGLHSKFVKEGMDARSDKYYARLDAEMRKHFPEQFGNPVERSAPESETRSTARSVVAGVTRSGPSKKVTLTQTQVAVAKRLGVPLELYAQQVVQLRDKSA